MDDESEDEPKSRKVRDAPEDLNWKINQKIHHKENRKTKAPKRRRKELKSQEVRDAPENLDRKKNREIRHEEREELSENENGPRRRQKRTSLIGGAGCTEGLEMEEKRGYTPPNNKYNQGDSTRNGQSSTRAKRSCSGVPNVS